MYMDKSTMRMLIDAYAEVNQLTVNEVDEEIAYGFIDGKDLFEAWLNYEGIFGYSRKIINVFGACEDAGIKITNCR